jgi:hypothetical protein
MEDEIFTEILIETENYMVYRTQEPDQEVVYHIETFNVTLHFFQEEWDEFAGMMREILNIR